ncbi:MAG: VCBS repeat-containing protein, partial [Myxococcota bacterium]|nr:VCBS repeat-containing protein [Myxococcota bacterium]
SSVFDFDGDGNAEVVYADERNFRVFDGKTGAVLLDDDTHRSNTRLEMPIVADVDNDGKAEVLVPNAGNAANYGGLEVWDDTDNNWVRTRRIWNQHTYHVSNISEDGQVPSYETPNWMSTRLNNFRQNVQPGGLFDAPDMVTDSIDVEYALCAQNNTVRIVVVVSNDGAVGVPSGIDVHAVVELSGTGEQFDLGVQKTNAPMLPGGQAQLVFEWIPSSSIGWVDFTVHVSVDDDGEGNGQYNECHEENNDLSSAQFKTCEPS